MAFKARLWCSALLLLGSAVYAKDLSNNEWKNFIHSNPSIQMEKETIGVQDAEKGRALAALLPHLDGESNRGLEQTETTSDVHLHPKLNSITIRQLLFDGLSKWNAYQSKRAAYKEANFSYQNTLNAISGQWMVGLISLKQATEVYKLEKRNNDYLGEMLKKVRMTLESNQVDRSSLFQAEGEFAEASSGVLQAEREKNIAKFDLERLTGHANNDLKSLPSVQVLHKTLPKTEKEYVRRFLNYSLPMRQNLERIEALRRGVNSAKGDFLPVVDVTGVAERDWDQLGTAGRRDVNTLMINTHFNFLKGGFDIKTLHMKKHQLQQAMQEGEEIRREELMKAKNIWLNYQFYKKNSVLLRRYRDNYQKTVDDYTHLFKVGEKDVMQLFVVNRQNMRAQRQYIQNKYEYQKSIVTAALAIQDVQNFFSNK